MRKKMLENSLYYIPIFVGLGGIVWYYLNGGTKKPVPPTTTVPGGNNGGNGTKPGLVSPKKRKAIVKKEKLEGKYPLKIFFGSQTGTAEDFSHKLAAEGKRYGFTTEVIDCEEYDWDDLKSEPFVMFLMATYGEGEPTDNARVFDEWISKEDRSNEELKNVKFTVFGLGNKTYEQYNAMGRKVDKRLEELGATRIFQRGEGDDDGSLEDDFAAWKKGMWPSLCEHFGMPIPEIEETFSERRFTVEICEANSEEAEIATSKSHIHLAKRNAQKEGNTYDIKNPYLAKLVVNYELHTTESDRSCRHIELEIGDALKYEVGDHLGVYSENDSRLVEDLAARLGVGLDIVFIMYPTDRSSDSNKKLFLGPCTVRQALTQWCDITNPPRKNVIKVLARYASDPEERQKLLALSDENNPQPYTSYVKDEHRTIFCILNEFKSIQIPFEHFLEIIPRLAPRYYSISSSLRETPGRVHITAVVVNYVTPAKREHHGVCTNWFLRQLPKDDKPILVPVFVEKANFRLPKDGATPIIMVGPGTGLAPFRGFIQERKHLIKEGQKSDALLFFGCRSRKIDFIYQEELLKAKEEGALTELAVAFSREGPEKVYVQHKMKEHMDLIWSIINDKNGYFYVCGDARLMAKDVRQTLKETIMKFGGKTEDEAEQYITDLQKSGRYLTDVWF